jgi:hypothetical protein
MAVGTGVRVAFGVGVGGTPVGVALRVGVGVGSGGAGGTVLEVSEAPVIASHSNPRARMDCQRNLTDDQLLALAGKGASCA